MRSKFLEYNPVDELVIKSLWDKATFIFDANVLLNLYRYSDETSKQFIKVVSELKDRVWIPYQVGLEFNRNRLSVISEQKKNYQDFEKKFSEILTEIENKSRNPFLSDNLFKKLTGLKQDIAIEFEKKISAYDSSLNIDPLLDKINAIFENKVGEILSESDLRKIYLEGEKRYKDKIPPGYCDLKKPDNEKFGDLILWKQIIQQSKDSSIDVIFISDDQKEDWWLEHKGKTISARPELLREFRDETGQNCHFYKPFQFLEYSNTYLGKEIKPEVIEEVKNHLPEDDGKTPFLQILLKGTKTNFELFAKDLFEAGYGIIKDSSEPPIENIFKLLIRLPNIPDLERRLHTKYITNLSLYSLELIDINS